MSSRFVFLLTLASCIVVHVSVWAGGNSGNRRKGRDGRNYSVTIQNLVGGQPMSPPVAATHHRRINMFKVGEPASPELEAIAEDGNQIPMFDLLEGARRVTQVVDIGMPLTPSDSVAGGFSDAATFSIRAHGRDRFSLATMLICTNDGFTGLDRGWLPRHGSRVFLAEGYDAGTENNSEESTDIVDPCSGIGPMPLPGDPNGNENDAVATDPADVIRHHPNITGSGDLTAMDHGWDDPVLKITVTVLDEHARTFATRLSGAGEVPPIDTRAKGWAFVSLNRHETELRFLLVATRIEGVTMAHIHMGSPNENGPVVAFLFLADEPTRHGIAVHGNLTAEDLVGPLEGDFAGLVERLRAARLYINVHTEAHPSGEIRGQLGAVY